MADERIKVRVTETGKLIEVLVYSKHEHSIEVMLGEGVHSVKCELTPTDNGLAYAGSAMGREIVYEHSPEEIAAELEVEHHDYRDSRRR